MRRYITDSLKLHCVWMGLVEIGVRRTGLAACCECCVCTACAVQSACGPMIAGKSPASTNVHILSVYTQDELCTIGGKAYLSGTTAILQPWSHRWHSAGRLSRPTASCTAELPGHCCCLRGAAAAHHNRLGPPQQLHDCGS